MEDGKVIERLAKVEVLVETLYHRSDERLNVIKDRFDGVDHRFDKAERRANWFWGLVITTALTIGGIYLEAVFSKDDSYKPLAPVRDERV